MTSMQISEQVGIYMLPCITITTTTTNIIIISFCSYVENRVFMQLSNFILCSCTIVLTDVSTRVIYGKIFCMKTCLELAGRHPIKGIKQK